MFECRKCGHEFRTARVDYTRHNLDAPPYEATLRCPECDSSELTYHPKKFCGFCGHEIPRNKKYCDEHCEKLGEWYRKREEEKKKKIYEFDVSKAIREVDEYNKTHSTDYSYGQYFALKGLGQLNDGQ